MPFEENIIINPLKQRENIEMISKFEIIIDQFFI